MRPVYKPEEEPLTLVMNGLDDNRDWKDNNLDQYIELDSVELIKNDGSTCELTAKTITKRYGNSAAYVNNMVIILSLLVWSCRAASQYATRFS